MTRVGDYWLLRYGTNIVRMRVSRVTAEGQCVLVESDPDPARRFTRSLVTNPAQLGQLGMPEEIPTVPNLPALDPLEDID